MGSAESPAPSWLPWSGAVLTGMLVVVVSEDVLGRRVTAADVWRRIRPRLWPLLLAAAIAGILPYVGLVFLSFPASSCGRCGR